MDRWLRRYLERRAIKPDPSRQSGVRRHERMGTRAQVALHRIVRLLLVEPFPRVKGNLFYYRLHEGLCSTGPCDYRRFLTALLSQEGDKDMWDWDQIHAMVERLIELKPAEPALRPRCEELGRLGSVRVIEFRGRLR
jgi:hypothetical protein